MHANNVMTSRLHLAPRGRRTSAARPTRRTRTCQRASAQGAIDSRPRADSYPQYRTLAAVDKIAFGCDTRLPAAPRAEICLHRARRVTDALDDGTHGPPDTS